jgi:lysophospholipase L1-like esterase
MIIDRCSVNRLNYLSLTDVAAFRGDIFMKLWRLLIVIVTLSVGFASYAANPSFADFDRRAKLGYHLNVVFFGASLTWSANASDQSLTSYRAVMQNYLEAKYPKAHFKCYDAAIGGTGSQLGVFRLNRDVLQRNPDMVFLDFAANDDIYSDNPETLASYESIVRRIIIDGKCPVVLMIFPFGWDADSKKFDSMKRRTSILNLAKVYNAPVGDAIKLVTERIEKKEVTNAKIWEFDQVHPGDLGYKNFADAALIGYNDGVARQLKCAAPEKMVYSSKYMVNNRVRISSLGPLPEGWVATHPTLTAAWHDGLMSRWLDDVSYASNRRTVKNADGKKEVFPQKCGRIKAIVNGEMVMLFGEEGVNAGKYHVYVDGKLVTYTPWGWKQPTDLFSAGFVAGTRQHMPVIVPNLDPKTDHLLEIEPVFDETKEQELKLESICVAGGKATVTAVK